ncbi:hypothetical protein E4U34_003848 [Claviceps purpurea]|nr:hypothetical protein E4U34_003848 [Claviceps purpurea]
MAYNARTTSLLMQLALKANTDISPHIANKGAFPGAAAGAPEATTFLAMTIDESTKTLSMTLSLIVTQEILNEN